MATPFKFGSFVGASRDTKTAANLNTDVHPSALVPLVGGAISGAVRPHPSRGRMSNVLGEGAAGLGGGVRGGLAGATLGGGLGALGGVRGLGAGAALGGAVGSALGTYRGAQLHRENTPLNARAMELLNRQSQAAPAKQAGAVGEMAKTVKDKAQGMAGKANDAAKTVANKAFDAGKKMQTGFEAWRKGQAKAAFGPMPRPRPVHVGGPTNAPRAPIGFVNGMPGTKQGPRLPRLGDGTDALSKGMGALQQGLDAVRKMPTMNTTVGTAGNI